MYFMTSHKELNIKLRNYLDADATSLIEILNSGKGLLLGSAGIANAASWSGLRSSMAAEQVIVAEKNLKSYLIGYVGLTNYSAVARRAELCFFCIGPETSRTVPDRKTLDCVLDWGFNVLGLNKITLEVIDGNAIIGILESAGFISEGLRKSQYQIGQNRVDSAILSLLAPAWRMA
jgi:RimJ/RimL family protein N-acetyltransferase